MGFAYKKGPEWREEERPVSSCHSSRGMDLGKVDPESCPSVRSLPFRFPLPLADPVLPRSETESSISSFASPRSSAHSAPFSPSSHRQPIRSQAATAEAKSPLATPDRLSDSPKPHSTAKEPVPHVERNNVAASSSTISAAERRRESSPEVADATIPSRGRRTPRSPLTASALAVLDSPRLPLSPESVISSANGELRAWLEDLAHSTEFSSPRSPDGEQSDAETDDVSTSPSRRSLPVASPPRPHRAVTSSDQPSLSQQVERIRPVPPPPPLSTASAILFGAGDLGLDLFGGGGRGQDLVEESLKKVSRMLRPGGASSVSASVGRTSPTSLEEEKTIEEVDRFAEALLEARRSFGEQEGIAARSMVTSEAPSKTLSRDNVHSKLSRSSRAREQIATSGSVVAVPVASTATRNPPLANKSPLSRASPADAPSIIADRAPQPKATGSRPNAAPTTSPSTSGIPSSGALAQSLSSDEPAARLPPLVARSRKPSRPLPPLTDEEKAEQRRRRKTGESADFGKAPWETKSAESHRWWKAYREVRSTRFFLLALVADVLFFPLQFQREKSRLECLVNGSASEGSAPLCNRLAVLLDRQPIEGSRLQRVSWLKRSSEIGALRMAPQQLPTHSCSTDPTQFSVWFQLGLCYGEAQDTDSAVTAMFVVASFPKRALTDDPSNAGSAPSLSSPKTLSSTSPSVGSTSILLQTSRPRSPPRCVPSITHSSWGPKEASRSTPC